MLRETAQPYEHVELGGQFGGLEEPSFLKLNPHGRVPVLKDGTCVVWESNAIVRYLAARYSSGTVWPEDPVERARADMWMDWMLTVLMPDMHPVFWGLVRTPEAERDIARINAAAKRLGESWRILDAHLAGRAFVAGEELTMGDTFVDYGDDGLELTAETDQGYPCIFALLD